MSYSQQITPAEPVLVVIAIDQSGSMLEPFEHQSMILSKSEVAAMVASAIIDELLARVRHTDTAHSYFELVAIGYSGIDAYPLLSDSLHPIPVALLEGREPEVVERVFEYTSPSNHLQLIRQSYRPWITPAAAGPTPLLEMLDRAADIISQWCSNRRNCKSYPPILFNITDGFDEMEYTGQYIQKSDAIKGIGTADGQCMVVNVCIDSSPVTERLNFPNMADIPTDHPAQMVAQMSSLLPARFLSLAKRYNPRAGGSVRALCYNAAALDIIPYLDMAIK